MVVLILQVTHFEDVADSNVPKVNDYSVAIGRTLRNDHDRSLDLDVQSYA